MRKIKSSLGLKPKHYNCVYESKIDQSCREKNERKVFMSIWRVVLCVIFPPLAVFDKGCGSIIITIILTLIGWVPGVIAALVINNK